MSQKLEMEVKKQILDRIRNSIKYYSSDLDRFYGFRSMVFFKEQFGYMKREPIESLPKKQRKEFHSLDSYAALLKVEAGQRLYQINELLDLLEVVTREFYKQR